MDIPLIKGKELDSIANMFGLTRNKLLWFIKESDNSLRNRLLKLINDNNIHTI